MRIEISNEKQSFRQNQSTADAIEYQHPERMCFFDMTMNTLVCAVKDAAREGSKEEKN